MVNCSEDEIFVGIAVPVGFGAVVLVGALVAVAALVGWAVVVNAGAAGPRVANETTTIITRMAKITSGSTTQLMLGAGLGVVVGLGDTGVGATGLGAGAGVGAGLGGLGTTGGGTGCRWRRAFARTTELLETRFLVIVSSPFFITQSFLGTRFLKASVT